MHPPVSTMYAASRTSLSQCSIRRETKADVAGMSVCLIAAFGSEEGANVVSIVQNMRSKGHCAASLVCERNSDKQIVGYISFCALTVRPTGETSPMSDIE